MTYTADITAAQAYWGLNPLPHNARTIGLITRDGFTGALIRFPTGVFAQGISGGFRTLPQAEVKALLSLTYATVKAGEFAGQTVAVLGDIVPGGVCLTDTGAFMADDLSA